MKKSLLTLGMFCCLSPGALAAVVVQPSFSLTEFTGVTQTVPVGNIVYSYHSGSHFRAPIFNEDGSATFTNDILNIYASTGTADLGKIGKTGTTITMTISGLSRGSASDVNNHAIFTAASGSNQWGVGINESGQISGTWGNSSYGNTSVNIPEFDKFVLTATISGANTYLYIDGVLEATISGLGTTSADLNIAYLMIGSETSSTNAGADFTIHDLYVHNTALNAEQVALFVASIPEPATASLTLLGLATLAMRRRRA